MNILIYDHPIERQEEGYIFISFNYCDKKRYGNKNYVCADEHLVGSDRFLDATDYLSKFSDYRINGETIKELISFEGVSLWWFYETAIRLNYIKYLRHIDRLNSQLYKKDVASILCDINDFILLSALKDFCQERGIIFQDADNKSISSLSIKRYAEYIRVGFTFLADLVISRAYNTRKSDHVVIASYTGYWSRYNVRKDVQQDGIFASIQKTLEKSNIKYIGIEYNEDSLTDYIKNRWSKHKNAPGKWIPLNAYATWKSILQSAEIFNKVNKKISQAEFKNNSDVFILKMLKNHIRTSFFLISEILSFENALSLIRPKVILTSCEYCKMGRAAVASGNKEHLPTVAIQHGIITPRHEGYIFSKLEKNSINDAVNSRPIPRYTLLYGPRDSAVLINNSTYPENSLIITGQPRYDYLYEISSSKTSDKFFENLKLGHPLIVWTSQPDRSDIESTKIIRSISNLLDCMHVNLFIKPHPLERDLSVYNPLTQRENVRLSKEVDIYKLLNACDLLINTSSTTAMEAAALNKPIIVLNLSGMPDVSDYVTEGIALGVYDEKDLPAAVKMLLENNDMQRLQREEYVKNHLYKIDGKSSERVAAFIKSLVDN
jgi:glycosyltransferase involved in cell wall biosynthesis